MNINIKCGTVGRTIPTQPDKGACDMDLAIIRRFME